MPRTTFKTVICTVCHKTRMVLNDPTMRWLVVGDTGPNAENHLRKIKVQFESNAILRWLFPDRVWQEYGGVPSWSNKQLYMPLNEDGKLADHGEPTFDAIGAGGAVVSRHFDGINADDLIGEDEYYSETEMSRKIDWSSGLESLLVPPAAGRLIDVPSTYWRTDDIYIFLEDMWAAGAEKVKTGPYSYRRGEVAVFRRGAIEDGKSIFPAEYDDKGKITNGYPVEFFQRLREKNPERYAAQYANDPKSADNAYFRSEYLRYYTIRDEEGRVLSVDQGNGVVKIVQTDQLYIVSMCDPAANGSSKRFRGGRGAVITTAVDLSGPYIYVLDVWMKRLPTGAIIDEIFRQNDKWQPQMFSIEANGLQRMLKYWIDERVERDNRTSIPYEPFIPKGEKDGDRRIKGLQPLFRAGQIFFQRGFNELIEEYEAWPRGFKDGLDCLSQGLEVWNVGWDSTTEEDMFEYENMLRNRRSVATGY